MLVPSTNVESPQLRTRGKLLHCHDAVLSSQALSWAPGTNPALEGSVTDCCTLLETLQVRQIPAQGLCTICITCVHEEVLAVVFSLLQFLHGFHGIHLSELSRDTDFSPNRFQSFSAFISPLTRKKNINFVGFFPSLFYNCIPFIYTGSYISHFSKS